LTIPAFPLQWPAGWKRTPPAQRKRAKFGKKGSGYGKAQLTVAEAIKRVRGELQHMGVKGDDQVVSTNVPLRLDGWPRSDSREPVDPGVAVYWRDMSKDGQPSRSMAIDMYDRVADNLAALAATLEAMRAIKRHGGAEILDRTFTGFTAIEHKKADHWSDVLDCDPNASTSEVREAFMRARSKAHPQNGGSNAEFHRVMQAYQAFCVDHQVAE
jgi:hypothetical protein